MLLLLAAFLESFTKEQQLGISTPLNPTPFYYSNFLRVSNRIPHLGGIMLFINVYK